MLRDIWNVMMREIRRSTKDSGLLMTLFIAPILYAFMYGSIYSNKVEREVKLAVIDGDGTFYSRLLTEQINASGTVEVVASADLQMAEELLKLGKVHGYFYIERGFEKKLLSLRQTNVTLALNASSFLPSSDITAAITQICLTIGGGVRKAYFSKQGMNDSQAMSSTNPIELEYRPLFNESSGYGSFILPGLLAIILQQTLLIGLCFNMALERQENTLGEIFEMTHNNLFVLLLGKALFYLLTFIIFSQFFLQINFAVFDMPMRGNYIQVSILFLLFIIAIIAMAFYVGSFFKNGLLVIQVLGFSSYPIFMITGYSMPFQSLPLAVQWLSNILPTTPFLKLYTIIVQGGADFTDQLGTLSHLLLLLLVYGILAYGRLNYLRHKI